MLRKLNRLRRVLAALILKSVVLMLVVAAPLELQAECPPPEYSVIVGWIRCHRSLYFCTLEPAVLGGDVYLNPVTGLTVTCLECCDFA